MIYLKREGTCDEVPARTMAADLFEVIKRRKDQDESTEAKCMGQIMPLGKECEKHRIENSRPMVAHDSYIKPK